MLAHLAPPFAQALYSERLMVPHTGTEFAPLLYDILIRAIGDNGE
jgi:hypothetical protein